MGNVIVVGLIIVMVATGVPLPIVGGFILLALIAGK